MEDYAYAVCVPWPQEPDEYSDFPTWFTSYPVPITSRLLPWQGTFGNNPAFSPVPAGQTITVGIISAGSEINYTGQFIMTGLLVENT